MVGARFSRTGLFTSVMALLLVAPVVVPGVEAAPIIIFEDDFNDGVPDFSKWVYGSMLETDICGFNSPSSALTSVGAGQGGLRMAKTINLDVSSGGEVSFYLKISRSAGACELADSGENVLLQYSIDDGVGWTNIQSYSVFSYTSFTYITEVIPLDAQTENTQFRWIQPKATTIAAIATDGWAIDDVVITGNGLGHPVNPPSSTIPSTTQSQTLPGQSLDTPPVTVPATCTQTACTTETPLATPPVPTPYTCAPLDVLCVGPGGVPAVPITDVPAICDEADFACIDPQTIPSEHLGDTPDVTVAVDFTGLDVSMDPHAAELTTVGPYVVPTPFAPVTICASTCPFPVLPEGSTLGSVTVTVTVGTETYSETIPLDQTV